MISGWYILSAESTIGSFLVKTAFACGGVVYSE